MLVKKYGNRRLYDTESSRYITLEELAEAIRLGKDARVVDAKTNADLTQSTLAQIILESRGASRLLPTPLLVQLIRMGDDALAEFFQRYVGWALQVYVQMKQNAKTLSALNPFGGYGFGGPGGFGGLFAGAPAPPAPEPSYAAPPEPDEPPPEAPPSDVAELRKELEELKGLLLAQAKKK